MANLPVLPVVMHRGASSAVAEKPSEFWQLVWDGYSIEGPWEPDLSSGYVRRSELADITDDAVAQAMEDYVPGVRLGYAERLTSFAPTTNVDIDAFSLTITGKGRPIDVRFHCVQAYHSAATSATPVLMRADIKMNGAAVAGEMRMVYNSSYGDGVSFTAPTPALADGANYVFTVGTWRGTAGTSTWFAGAGGYKMTLEAVSC